MRPAGAQMALILAAMFWGFGNIAQKTVLDHVGPLTATCLKCAIAAVAVLPLARMEATRMGITRAETGQAPRNSWWRSIIFVSAAFTAGMLLQQTAYLSTSVTNASFLVNADAVLTPIAAWLLLRETTGPTIVVAAAVTFVGVFLMSGTGTGLTDINRGDMLCLLAAVAYALWMVALGRHARNHGMPFRSSAIQFAFAALLAAPIALSLEPLQPSSVAKALPELLALGLFSTAAAFSLQTIAQRYTTASRAAVLVAGESVFGALAAYVVLGERPTVWALLGASLILAAILMVALSAAAADDVSG